MLPEHFKLDPEQKRAFWTALDGTPAYVVLLEGYPGIGKSAVLACLIVALMAMEYRVMIVCQSNSGVDALHNRVIKCLTEELAAMPETLDTLAPSVSTGIAVKLVEPIAPVGVEATLLGSVHHDNPKGYEFRVTGMLPAFLQDHRSALRVSSVALIHVYWTDVDEDTRRKIRTVNEACFAMEEHLPKDGIIDIDGRSCGKFCLRNIIADQEVEYHAPNLFQELPNAGGYDGPVDRHHVVNLINELPDIFDLDDEQEMAFWATLDSPLFNVLLVEGFPGTGNSTVLACLMIALLAMGIRVTIVCQ